jgi:hypothetical protein
MSGEMHPSEVTAENFPLHFAVVKEFGGDVQPFDQYQGPYIRYAGKRGDDRYFLSTDDGVFACWWNESTQRFSPAFTATDDDVVFAVAAFRELIEEGGTEEPEWIQRNAERVTLEILAASLATYCSGDDVALPRPDFLRMVADRITEDLPPRQNGYIKVPAMPKQYTFTGTVYYYDQTSREKVSAESMITITAPSQKVAKAILRNYGMDSMRLVK